jgi:hypothetical protein
MKRLYNELAFARLALRESRRNEVKALKAYSEARNPLRFDPECPEPSRSTGVTKADREEWINAKIADLYWAHQGAKVVRESAEDYSRQLREQVKCVQSIGANARQAYDIVGRAS